MAEVDEEWRKRILGKLTKTESHHTLIGGQVLTNVHDPTRCNGQYCCIHHPSPHHMVDWPQNYRPDRQMMERICVHGCGHPDPDDPATYRDHGCDGCCRPPGYDGEEDTDYFLPNDEEDVFRDTLLDWIGRQVWVVVTGAEPNNDIFGQLVALSETEAVIVRVATGEYAGSDRITVPYDLIGHIQLFDPAPQPQT